MSRRLLTIGAYGFEPAQFFAALENARVDVFLDIRQRRGLRGSRYAFANVGRLSVELERRDIAYRHVKDLAPDSEIRDLQRRADAAAGALKSGRLELAPAFVEAYTAAKLNLFDWERLAEELQPFRAPVLFCVEQHPRGLPPQPRCPQARRCARRRGGELDAMSRVLVVARTRMNQGRVCVGGHDLDQDFRSLRLLTKAGMNIKEEAGIEVGEVWELDYVDHPEPDPPHVEDVLVSEGKRIESRLAERTHVQEGTLARSLLATALDDADPDASRITEILDAIPGAWERTQEGLAQAAR